ncbi:MAG: hypothetical protein JNL26_16215 [Gemmatimonadetes bacterium]|nr:hypothetical protein [Gemmatimonadota bacterium]
MTTGRIAGVAAAVWLAFGWWMYTRFPGVAVWQVGAISGAVALQLPPFLAVRAAGADASPARRWIGWWALAFFVADVAQLLISERVGSNLMFILLTGPIEDGCLLWAYSYWQLRPVLRLSFRVSIPLLAIASIGLALYAGEAGDFQAVSGPFRLLIMTAAIAFTLVSRAVNETGRIWQRDWMWVSLGTMLYYAAYVVVNPISKALMDQSVELAQLVYVVKAVVDMAAFLMVWKGVRCPVETSSQSTSLPFSRSS